MELRLGLALPNSATDHDPTSGGRPGIDLDLNMDIGGGYYGCGSDRQPHPQQYRQFRDVEGWGNHDDDAYEEGERESRTVPRTLPLLHWTDGEGNGDEDEGEDDGADYMDTDSSRYHQPNRGASSSANSNYVKVAMEGIGIGRKVDLSLHQSFHALKDTLLPMFGIYNEDSDNYKLAYQDRGGQWVVAEDSSWRNFIRSAQRLKMVKISG